MSSRLIRRSHRDRCAQRSTAAQVRHRYPRPPGGDDTFRLPCPQPESSGGDTVVTGSLADRAALYRVLAEIETLGLKLLEVRRLPPV